MKGVRWLGRLEAKADAIPAVSMRLRPNPRVWSAIPRQNACIAFSASR